MRFPEHKCGLCLEHNTYKDVYEPIATAILNEDGNWINPQERARALETGEIWTLHWYPNTPVSFNRLAASTLATLFEAANVV